MQNLLTLKEQELARAMLTADRQWKRSVRIAKAHRDLRMAYRNDPDMVPIRKFILRRLDYDWIDKVHSNVE